MRLTSFHIDGFGALADIGLEEMAPGLVVILGANEAGKSTLFDFLAGVLFGFPTRKDNPRYHAPARGGRHGGRVRFVDEVGGTWTVERHAGPQKGLEVRLPDGSEGDDTSVTRALAGASSSLFRAVFAVGLDDLGQMGNLESDEVRELLFAASIFGQRRSATTAMKHLADARDELARPRRDDATANRLAVDLEAVRAELATARREAAQYDGMQREAAAAEEQMRATRSQLKVCLSRVRELEVLDTCWRHYCDATRAREAMSVLPETVGGEALLEHGTELRSLAAELSGHNERATKLEELARNRASLDTSIERRLAGLGALWTRERAIDAPDPELLADSVHSARERLSAAQTRVVSAAAVLAQAEAMHAEYGEGPVAGDPTQPDEALDAAAGTERTPSMGHVPDAVQERRTLELMTAALAELRERASEAERLELEIVADERDHPWVPPMPSALGSSARRVVLVGWGLALAGSVLGAVLLARGETAPAFIAAVLGVIVGVALAAAARRRSARTAVGQPAVPTTPLTTSAERATDRAEMLARTRARIGELAGLLDLEVPPARVDVERRAMALEQAREARRRLDELSTARAESQARVARAAEADLAARGAVTLQQQAHASWCDRHGFVAGDPEETLEAIAALAELREQLTALGRVDKAMDTLEGSVTSFARRCASLLDLVEARVIPAGPQDPLRVSGELGAFLGGLVRLLDEAAALEARRSQLERELSSAGTALEHALGGGAGSERMRAELAGGDVLGWASERADIEPTIDGLRSAEEDAVRRHQSVAEAMVRLGTSDRIADLQRRQDAIEVELERALQQYLVLATARVLLQRTLARHERERQPAVVASAAAHFERVTGGRYTALLADGGPDGRQSIRVLSRTGEAIDAANLSRGTIEQLYLCLRLGLADSFAERSISLPIVLDDVLVNFDPDRAAAVASELVASARSHQMVFLTCHPHLADMMLRANAASSTETQLVELGQRESDNQQAALPLLTALPPLSA